MSTYVAVNSHNSDNTIIVVINVYNVLDGAHTWQRGVVGVGSGGTIAT